MKAKVLLLLLIACPSLQAGMSVDFFNDATIGFGDVYNEVDVYDNAKIQMFGGSINRLYTYDSSVFNIYGGQIYPTLGAFDFSTINIYGGIVSLPGGCILSNNSSLNIYGGNIQIISIYASGSSATNIFGYGFSDWPANALTGFLSDGTPFNFAGLNSDYVYLHTTPEPATVLMLGWGLIILLRTR